MMRYVSLFVVFLMLASGSWSLGADKITEREWESAEQSVLYLGKTHGNAYPNVARYLNELNLLRESKLLSDKQRRERFDALRREALLASPLLDSLQLLVVKRAPRDTRAKDYFSPFDHNIGFSNSPGLEIAMPSNHECNSSLPRTGYNNEIAILSNLRNGGTIKTLFKPEQGGYVGEVDLHFNGGKILFTQSHPDNWRIWEMGVDGKGLHQISQMPSDIDSGDATYLPNGHIVFGSTASYQSVPCWHGQKRVSNLFVMDGDGNHARQLCFDQDHNFHPTVLPNGQVLYHRWDYTGINHIFMRQLMVMNPDGTGQRAIYGSNSWFPNSIYFPRSLPSAPNHLLAILSGYHGVHRMGQLVILNTGKSSDGVEALTLRISGQGQKISPQTKDALVDRDWPKFLHPTPLDDKYFLVSGWMQKESQWAIYLADAFDNVIELYREPGYALLEPTPVLVREVPPVIPDRTDLSRKDAVVYLHNVYMGPGLKGVPEGTVKRLRLISYNFAYPGLGGPDKIGYGGPWEAMRILGTTPVEKDGSAFFRIPANTPVAIQPLDSDGKAVQLMRSWFTAMPGETISCVGCHEPPAETTPPTRALAARRAPCDLEPWRGPARGFDFAREVQPVLNRYCIGCHDGKQDRPDLRPEEQVPDYKGKELSDLGRNRLHPTMSKKNKGMMFYTPAYDALLPYVRRVSIEDDVSLLTPCEYHADSSPLFQMLSQGHHGVKLDTEAWDRFATWIDMNAPCHGTWNDAFPIPDNAHERRMALREKYSTVAFDPETVPEVSADCGAFVMPEQPQKRADANIEGWPLTSAQAASKQKALGEWKQTLNEGNAKLEMLQVPEGSFISGSKKVSIKKSFWISATEITNAQFRQFDPTHNSGYYTKRHARADDKGITFNADNQPIVRVSWQQAMAYCDYLSQKTGKRFSLPTEEEWEYACKAGASSPMYYGETDADFAPFANYGDRSFSRGFNQSGHQVTGGVHHLAMEGAFLAMTEFNDNQIVTAPVGLFKPNTWGLRDMHGNVAEWTRTEESGKQVVRGGSFFDNPKRGQRQTYPRWQRIFNVGFRVVRHD